MVSTDAFYSNKECKNKAKLTIKDRGGQGLQWQQRGCAEAIVIQSGTKISS